MRGHLRERSPGHWAIVIDTVDAATGKRKRKWHSFEGTKRQAQVRCAELIAQSKDAGYIVPSKATFAEFLTRWIEHKRGKLSAQSHKRYSELVRLHIAPALGGTPLKKIEPQQIDSLYTQLGERVSAETVIYVHRILKQALQQAIKWKLLAGNPADAAEPPKAERPTMQALDADGIAALLDASRGMAVYMPILLAVMTGMRRGEIAALRWRSVDFSNATLAVVASIEKTATGGLREKPPKNGRGRSLALSPMLLDELRQHRARQAEHLLRHGVRLTDDHHVVMRGDGLPYQPRTLTDSFDHFLSRRPKLKRIRFHDLRHTHCSQLLASGVHVKVAQERLGHHSAAFTLDRYSHTIPSLQADAARLVDKALRKAMARRVR